MLANYGPGSPEVPQGASRARWGYRGRAHEPTSIPTSTRAIFTYQRVLVKLHLENVLCC